MLPIRLRGLPSLLPTARHELRLSTAAVLALALAAAVVDARAFAQEVPAPTPTSPTPTVPTPAPAAPTPIDGSDDDAVVAGEEEPAAPFDPVAAVAALESGTEPEREAALAALRTRGPALAPDLEALLARRAAADERLEGLLAELDPARSRARAAEAGGAATEPWYLEKVRRAAELMQADDHLTAIHHLDAILVLEPQCPIRQQLRGMIVRAKELLIRASVVEVQMVPARALLTGRDPLRFSIELKNVSDLPVRLGPGDGEAVLRGALELEIYAVEVGGATRRARHLRNVEVHVSAVLAPGAITATEVSLKPFGGDSPRLYRRARVRGAFRPDALVHGEEKLDRFLPLFPVDIAVVDERRLALAAEPTASLEAALADVRGAPTQSARRDAEERAVLAALLAPGRDREAVRGLLLAALQKPDDPAQPAALAALAAVYEEQGRTREGWLAWGAQQGR